MALDRVDSLTPQQEARIGEWRDRWIQIGLCTDPADRASFERAVIACYQFAKLEAPKRVVWVQSPLVLAFAGPIAGHILDHGAVGAVNGAVNVAVNGAVRGAVGGAVGRAVHDAVRDNWYRYLGGQFWVGGWWGSSSFVSFFRDVCGLTLGAEMDARAVAWETTARSACWWWPHQEFVIACERPAAIHRDEQGRLHCETGQAIEFRDGWGVSVWHGTTVPHEWITERDTLDPATALTWPNVEQRRAAAEIVGWAKVLASLPTRSLDRDDPEVGELLSVDLPDAPDSRFLRVRCATGRDFVLPVPRDCKTAIEANCWTFPMITREDFNKREVRT